MDKNLKAQDDGASVGQAALAILQPFVLGLLKSTQHI